MTDKEKLIELIERSTEGWLENACQPYGVETLADYLLANGVTVRPQGEWIDEGEVYLLELHSYQCSNCKQEEVMFPHRKADYCPNCGASMKGAGD